MAESTTDAISERYKKFIESRDMSFIATADDDRWPESSYKAGEPGFVRVVDEHTLAFPSTNGNGMFLTSGNLAVNPKVGLIFIDFSTGHPATDEAGMRRSIPRIRRCPPGSSTSGSK